MSRLGCFLLWKGIGRDWVWGLLVFLRIVLQCMFGHMRVHVRRTPPAIILDVPCTHTTARALRMRVHVQYCMCLEEFV